MNFQQVSAESIQLISMLWLIVWGSLFCSLFYYYCIRPLRYWKKRGVKQGNPVWLFGDNLNTLLRRESFQDSVKKWYRAHPNERYSGIYQMMLPILIVRDPDLIKQIMVKDFEHFMDHRSFAPEEADPLWTKNVFTLQGKEWRQMRSILSPCYTSSKMKTIFAFMCEVAGTITEHLKNREEETLDIEMNDICYRYTNDVIASVAFGLRVDSLNEPNNIFFRMGKELTDFSGLWKMFKFFGYTMFPKVFQLLHISLFSKNVSQFFLNTINETIKIREGNGIVRQDMIHLLLEARKGVPKLEETANKEDQEICKRNITNLDIAANCLIFFFAGFDSVATAIALMLYELGINADIQKRLKREIDETNKSCNGKLTYEALMDMKYMDMVLSETLRKWVIGFATDRKCTKPYTIQPVRPNEKPVELKMDDLLIIPTAGLLHDPQYYPQPDKFDPERFSHENRPNIIPFTNLVFGAGPRICIGNRFALLECKTLVYHLLLNFEILPVKKTSIPLKLEKNSITVRPENGIWLGLRPLGN